VNGFWKVVLTDQ